MELPGYAPPARSAGPAGGRYEPQVIAGRTTDPVAATVWSPQHLPPEDQTGLLVVHDGPEYAELAALTRFVT